MQRRRWLIGGLLLLLLLVGSLGWYQQQSRCQASHSASGLPPAAETTATLADETGAGDAAAPGADRTLPGEAPAAQPLAAATGDAPSEPPAKSPAIPITRPAERPTIAQTRTVPAGGYTPGAQLDIQLALDYPADGMPVTALGVAETIPRGWTFGEVTSEPKPEIVPPPGARLHLEFAWTKIPAFPLKFTYTVHVPASEGGGTREIVGRTLFRAEGPEGRSRENITKLTRK